MCACLRNMNNPVHGSSKLQVTILASEWRFSKGGLSTINRELAIQLAKFSDVEVSFFLPKCSDEDKEAAHNKGAYEKRSKIKRYFKGLGINSSHLKVRRYMDDQEYLRRLFCEADLLLMPSRTEGFGIIGLEALSAGLPVIVSKNSGFGEALSRVLFGSMCYIDSEDPCVWTMTIKDIWDRDRKLRLEEVKKLRHFYGKRYSWSHRCRCLVEKMIKLRDGTSCDPETTAQEVESREPKRKKNLTGHSSRVPSKREKGIEKNESEQPAGTSCDPETTAQEVETRERKQKRNLTGHSSRVPSKREKGIEKNESEQPAGTSCDPETTAQEVETRERKRKRNLTGHSSRVPSKREKGIEKNESEQPAGTSCDPETTAQEVETRERKQKRNLTGHSSRVPSKREKGIEKNESEQPAGTSCDPETTAQEVETRERKRKRNLTGHSSRVPSKREKGIEKNESEQPAGTSCDPETTAQEVETRERKQKRNLTGHSSRVPSKREKGIEKNESEQPAGTSSDPEITAQGVETRKRKRRRTSQVYKGKV
ncbi:uncharacterized protein LOC141879807 isoform X3 [Acropora palmata]|uniref:uncharacterized protein LOC141879807 isoform X3 n=1 Tax=Acropora palmata TaxID=6131 RepID=UPI003DA0BE97